MKKILTLTVLLLTFLAACLSPSGDEVSTVTEDHAQWGYEGELGPVAWATLDSDYALCATGRQQSPINLPGDSEPTLADVSFDYRESAVHIKNNGHTIQIDYEAGSRIEINGQSYELTQFHFHAPSEHTVADRSYPIELHLVHQSLTDDSLAVVGVFIDEGVENVALAPVWSYLPPEQTDVAVATGTSVKAADLLPAERTLYRYRGSLTTPGCDENVIWSVMGTPIQMSASQIAAFTDIFSGNNRPLQPLLDQEVQLSDAP